MWLAVAEVQQEMSSVQKALISSEERRLQVGRALLDFKLEHNTTVQQAEEEKYELRQVIIDLEGRVAQGIISTVWPPTSQLQAMVAAT